MSAPLPPEIQTAIDAMQPEFRARFLLAVEALESPAMLYAIAGHLMAGNAFAAMIVATSDPRLYAVHDAHMRLAFAAGKANRG